LPPSNILSLRDHLPILRAIHPVEAGQQVLVPARRLADEPLQPVALGREPAMLLRDGEAEPGYAQPVRLRQHGEVGVATPVGTTEDTPECSGIRQTVRPAEPLTPPVLGCCRSLSRCRRRDRAVTRNAGAPQGVSCARPFARRRFRTSRPALVAMRARKPCVRARLSLLGWKVRFMCLTRPLRRG